MKHKLCLLDFSGNLISSYDLNLPTGSNPVWYIGASNYGHVYLITSVEEESGKTCLMYMGKF
ncbi:MAG: hypothetical protein H5T50_07665 [Nitrososphaeria archaeon]|nr:hypothetical protein [Nitrososphaeria archaeon]